jgi:hypothetical protein
LTRLAAMRLRIDQRFNQPEVVEDRHGPAMSQDQRQSVVVGRANMQEMDILPIDGGGELRIGVEFASQTRQS